MNRGRTSKSKSAGTKQSSEEEKDKEKGKSEGSQNDDSSGDEYYYLDLDARELKQMGLKPVNEYGNDKALRMSGQAKQTQMISGPNKQVQVQQPLLVPGPAKQVQVLQPLRMPSPAKQTQLLPAPDTRKIHALQSLKMPGPAKMAQILPVKKPKGKMPMPMMKKQLVKAKNIQFLTARKSLVSKRIPVKQGYGVLLKKAPVKKGFVKMVKALPSKIFNKPQTKQSYKSVLIQASIMPGQYPTQLMARYSKRLVIKQPKAFVFKNTKSIPQKKPGLRSRTYIPPLYKQVQHPEWPTEKMIKTYLATFKTLSKKFKGYLGDIRRDAKCLMLLNNNNNEQDFCNCILQDQHVSNDYGITASAVSNLDASLEVNEVNGKDENDKLKHIKEALVGELERIHKMDNDGNNDKIMTEHKAAEDKVAMIKRLIKVVMSNEDGQGKKLGNARMARSILDNMSSGQNGEDLNMARLFQRCLENRSKPPESNMNIGRKVFEEIKLSEPPKTNVNIGRKDFGEDYSEGDSAADNQESRLERYYCVAAAVAIGGHWLVS